MRWLVTVKADHDVDALASALTALGASVNPNPVPLDRGECVYTVDGPDDLRTTAKAVKGIMKLNPASKLQRFG